jgi:hypothetical protein
MILARIYRRLPGPAAVRVAQAVALVVVTLALLGLFYEWLGSTFLDNGGRIG